MSFRLSYEPLPEALLSPDDRVGGSVTFLGTVRDFNEGKPVLGLTYEAFEELAEKEGAHVIQEALHRFPILAAACVHRLGALELGDVAIVVQVGAPHRAEAFEACAWIVDQIKSRVPIWKKERYRSGQEEWLKPSSPEEPV